MAVQLSLTLRWCPECREMVLPGPVISGMTREVRQYPRLAELLGCSKCGTLTKEKEL